MSKYEPEKTPTEELIDAAKRAVEDYESYLLDQMGWRELAQTISTVSGLKETILHSTHQ